jgi:glycosyltransferase involved in cell wall biosynthesis
MKIAIDVSPLQTGHKVRGVGFYLTHLKDAMAKYFPENDYIFFERGDKIPKDVELVHFPYFEPFFLALPIYQRYKTVVTVHDLTPILFPKAFPRGIKGEIKWQMQKHALKRANAVITDSNSSKNDIIKLTGIKEDKINVVYLAAGEKFRKLEIGNWKLEIKKRYNLPDRFVLYVGDVTWNKNLPRILDAVIEARVPIVLVGKNLVSEDYDRNNPWNNDLNRIQEIINNQKSKNSEQITRLGFIPDEDLVAIYNLATAFVMPSIYEGFGLPILEAMACGCPVITSKESSLGEVAGNSAFFVDAYDYKSIASAIKEVFNNKTLQNELSEKGIDQAKKFSWKKTAEDTLEMYKRILE